ncbi:MAG: hypothetical protein R3B72_24455 [Polyangiaceae bacterium]
MADLGGMYPQPPQPPPYGYPPMAPAGAPPPAAPKKPNVGLIVALGGGGCFFLLVVCGILFAVVGSDDDETSNQPSATSPSKPATRPVAAPPPPPRPAPIAVAPPPAPVAVAPRPAPIAVAPPPAPVPAPVFVPPPPPPPAAPTFVGVAEGEWIPRLGPKMKAGSRVAHQVFKGPFGPSPQSLFAVIIKESQFHCMVMGDDNKSWPAGPLHDDFWLAHTVLAVSFFDADRDGTLDALVMMKIEDAAGTPGSFNALLRWTNMGLRRMLNLEGRIQEANSVAKVRQILGV